MDHMVKTVTNLGRQQAEGFAETRKMFEQSEQRATTRDGKLHQRITEHQTAVLQKGQVSWPLVVSCIVALIALGGIGVSFVKMSLDPVDQQVDEVKTDASKREMQLDEHRRYSGLDLRNIFVDLGKQEERLNATNRHVDSIDNQLQEEFRPQMVDTLRQNREIAAAVGTLTAIGEINTANRFTSQEGRDLQRRLQSVEARLVDLAAAINRAKGSLEYD